MERVGQLFHKKGLDDRPKAMDLETVRVWNRLLGDYFKQGLDTKEASFSSATPCRRLGLGAPPAALINRQHDRRKSIVAIYKKRPYCARTEYRAAQSDIEARLERGYSLKLVYEDLLKAGRLTMAYPTFCDYVRGGGTRLHRRKNETTTAPDPAELLSEIMDSIKPRIDSGLNLKSVYQKMAEHGIIGFSYSDFCDYFRGAGGYLGRDIPDDFVFFEDDGLITFYYRLASLFDSESDSAGPEFLQ
ncbi:MAG: TraK family protein [Candidatus Adiutrix sp.]|jgi:hypothetical protein|nr:TraK family protein [Candidatus Adiutrix sp.]